jgi:hypothetical protein
VASVDTVVDKVAGDSMCSEAAGRTARDSTCSEAAETVDMEVVAIVVVMVVSLLSDKVEAIAMVRCLVVG